MLGEVLQRFLVRVLVPVTKMFEQRKHDRLEIRDGHKSPSLRSGRNVLTRILLAKIDRSNGSWRAYEASILGSGEHLGPE